MDFRSRIRSVLKKGRTERLPDDPHDAQYHLLPLVIEGKFKAISSLLANSSFDVNQKFRRDGRTLLHQAVSNPATVNVLLEAGADTNVQDLGGCTPLHIAARNGSTESIQILVNNGADVYKVDFEGLSALHYAALHGKLDLLKAVARVMRKQSVQGVLNVKDFKSRTPLSYAADNGHTEIVEYLLKHGAEVDVPDESGQTSLLRAISRGHEGCVKHLLEHNADITQRSKDGSTILEILVKNNHIRCLSLLNQPVFDIIKLFTCAEVEYDNVISCIDHINGERNVKRELWDALCEVTFRHVEELLASDFYTKDYLFNKYIRALDHIRRLPDYKEVNPGSPRHKNPSGTNSLDRKTIKISAPQNPQILRTYTVSSIMSNNTSITNDALDTVWTMLARHMMICKQYLIETRQPLPSPGTRSRPSSFLNNDPWSLPQENTASHKSSDSREEPHQSSNIRRSSLRVILPDDVDEDGSPVNELEDPVAKFSLHLCSLIEGYHTWCRNTTQFKEFLDFITTHASVIKVFIQRDHQLIFNQLNFLLESPIAMKQFQNIRSAMYKESLENRKSWMYTRLYQKSGVPDETLSSDIKVFNINRENVFGSSCEQVMGQDASLLQEGIAIKFEGDEGIGSGLRKEWFTLITEQITDGNYGLFQLCNEGLNFHPSRYSQVHPDHLSHFEFAGRVMALSIFYKNTIDIHFTKSFYKQILGIPVDYTDVACIDADVANSLQWCLNNDISQEGFTFHIEEENFDNIETIELKPGGAHIEVTEENKHEYVELYSEYKLTNAIKNQIQSFLKGFFEIIPRSYVAVFTPAELELIMCGLPDIDKHDWSDSTTYGDDVSPQTKYWFWEIIEELSQKECAQLLRFFTGYSRVPHGGFSQIGRNVSAGGVKIAKLLDVNDDYIPKAQVCFNTLLLPEYSSKEIMEKKLRVVIAHAHEGFELT